MDTPLYLHLPPSHLWNPGSSSTLLNTYPFSFLSTDIFPENTIMSTPTVQPDCNRKVLLFPYSTPAFILHTQDSTCDPGTNSISIPKSLPEMQTFLGIWAYILTNHQEICIPILVQKTLMAAQISSSHPAAHL
jgi:hypothetical protein